MKLDSQSIKKERLSNMELLRIISMALVLAVHSDFNVLGIPSPDEISSPSTFMRFIVESVSIVSVNCFILISGYFGVKFSFRSILNVLFQVFFFALITLPIAFFADIPLDFPTLVTHFDFCNGIKWFVITYIALIVISPILNAFVLNTPKNQFLSVIIAFAALQLFCGYLDDSLHFFEGYSLGSFVFLYITARYIKLHGGKIFEMNKYVDLAVFSICSIILCVICYINVYTQAGHIWDVFNYNNPIIIIESIALLLFFSKLSFKSRIINWIAASAFSVYLLHTDSFIFNSYKDLCNSAYQAYDIFSFSLIMVGLIIGIFTLSVIIDQLRIFIWNRILSLYNR